MTVASAQLGPGPMEGQCLLELAQLHAEPHRDCGLKISNERFADAVRRFQHYPGCGVGQRRTSPSLSSGSSRSTRDLRPAGRTAVQQAECFLLHRHRHLSPCNDPWVRSLWSAAERTSSQQTSTFSSLKTEYFLTRQKGLCRVIKLRVLRQLSWMIRVGPVWLFSRSVTCDSLQPHGLQHTRLPCPSPSPGVCSNLCPLSQ